MAARRSLSFFGFLSAPPYWLALIFSTASTPLMILILSYVSGEDAGMSAMRGNTITPLDSLFEIIFGAVFVIVFGTPLALYSVFSRQLDVVHYLIVSVVVTIFLTSIFSGALPQILIEDLASEDVRREALSSFVWSFVLLGVFGTIFEFCRASQPLARDNNEVASFHTFRSAQQSREDASKARLVRATWLSPLAAPLAMVFDAYFSKQIGFSLDLNGLLRFAIGYLASLPVAYLPGLLYAWLVLRTLARYRDALGTWLFPCFVLAAAACGTMLSVVIGIGIGAVSLIVALTLTGWFFGILLLPDFDFLSLRRTTTDDAT